jgi:hypothetical protein
MGIKVSLRHDNLMHAYLNWEQLTLEYGRYRGNHEVNRTQLMAKTS